MTFLRTWLLSVVASAVLVSAAVLLAGDGTMRRVVRFTGGVVLLIALLRPLLEIELSALSIDVPAWRAAAAELEITLSTQQNAALSSRIAEQTAAYIEDKADELGISVRAEVTTEETEGVPLPASVRLYGGKNEALSAYIAHELGIAEERQEWIETTENACAP